MSNHVDLPPALRDVWQRPLRKLRLSLTDRCNLRCRYCIARTTPVWMPTSEILSTAEIGRLVTAFTGLGVSHVHLTGGEPLLRPDVEDVISLLAQSPDIGDLSMITNGVALAPAAEGLLHAGLRRVTVSLDTLRPERFEELTGRNALAKVLEGLYRALAVGFRCVKVNMVVWRGVNDDELVAMAELGRSLGVEVRFIEYMAMGDARHWSPEQVVSQEEITTRLAEHYGPIETVSGRGSAPAGRFQLPDGTRFGVIAPVTAPFCGDCDRGRLTADGRWHHCLHSPCGLDLRALLRQGASEGDIRATVMRRWRQRLDRGAEERREARLRQSAPTAPRESPSVVPLPMHALGG